MIMTRKDALKEILVNACEASEIYVNGRRSVKLVEKTGQLFYVGGGADMQIISEFIPNWNLQKDFGYLMEFHKEGDFYIWQSKPLEGKPCISIAYMR